MTRDGFAQVKRITDIKGDGNHAAIIVYVPDGYVIHDIKTKTPSPDSCDPIASHALQTSIGIRFIKEQRAVRIAQ